MYYVLQILRSRVNIFIIVLKKHVQKYSSRQNDSIENFTFRKTVFGINEFCVATVLCNWICNQKWIKFRLCFQFFEIPDSKHGIYYIFRNLFRIAKKLLVKIFITILYRFCEIKIDILCSFSQQRIWEGGAPP